MNTFEGKFLSLRKVFIAFCPPFLLHYLRKILGHYDLPFKSRFAKWGHRSYVGGSDPECWYGIGRLQYHLLVANGLKSNHKMLDVGCGCLRLGQFLIPMLERGNYCGLDVEITLIEAGIESEIDFDVIQTKKPQFLVNAEFDLSKFTGYDFAMAQSLFTHLAIDDIDRCFRSLSSVANPGSKFFFTFFEGDEAANGQYSHSHKNWSYQFSTLEKIAIKHGFKSKYIGDWGHPRKQVIAMATK